MRSDVKGWRSNINLRSNPFEARLPLGSDSPGINGSDESSEGFHLLTVRRSGRIGGEGGGMVSAALPPARTKTPSDAVARLSPVRRESGHWRHRTATLDVYLLSRFHDERSPRIDGFCEEDF